MITWLVAQRFGGIWVKDRVPREKLLAGVTLVVAAVALFGLTAAGRSGASAVDDRPALLGEARQASLTVGMPVATNDRIYGAPSAAGRPIIVIDAGHGGRDPGATSVSGEVREKELTLALARELRDILVERGRVRVALTRDDDRYLTLEDRAAVARRLGASLFISLHTDSAPNPLARGATVYSLSDVASDGEAARLAAAQNGDAVATAQDASPVASMLADLAMRSEMNASADFSMRLLRKSAGRFELRPDPHRFAAFHVLRRADTPAVLFEAGYISNVDDEALLRSPEHRSAMVLALAQAVEADVATRSRR
ncbi:N-acetylmuramoyl-L-alanine amidase family protein [Sphingomonas hankyongi]|uniref:N-acetylmuramoyl-L-alanine amidase n=1 Tax=Sphingomonas hankyongi TaxID=2908209 RepID=A0ABT0RYX0_9SPHN|nr:N-acetylmuramoyl-L-alanine amidase [Sphingomonas hankyongi]MCL6728807.1 N-acetylmuramoyl-L-alanine amidase [Sphingomonas hankyongi]